MLPRSVCLWGLLPWLHTHQCPEGPAWLWRRLAVCQASASKLYAELYAEHLPCTALLQGSVLRAASRPPGGT